MSTTSPPEDLDALTRASQVIVAALITSVVGFLVVILVALPSSIKKAPDIPANLISYVALGVGAAGLALSFAMPGVVAAGGRRQIAREVPAKTTDAERPARLVDGAMDTPRLASLYQKQLIVGAAMLEGAALFNAIAYMLDRLPVSLAVVVVLVLVLASRMPTRDRVDAWIDGQSLALQEDRQVLL